MTTKEASEVIVDLPLAKIVRHPDNPRTPSAYTKKKLEPLWLAMQKNGVIPIVVRKLDDGTYEACAGNRRHAALEVFGAKTAPCIVREMDDKRALLALLGDNTSPEDCDEFLEARDVKKLRDMDMSLEEIAEGTGWSVRTVSRRSELLNLCPTLLEERKRPDSPVARWPISWIECVVQLDPVIQERWYHENGGKAAAFGGLDDVEASVARYLRHLGKAPWDLADKTLYPKAGSCTDCEKHSANEKNRGMFGVTKKADAADINQAICRDAECFLKKLCKFGDMEVARQLEKNPEIALLKGPRLGFHDDKLAHPHAKTRKSQDVIESWGWERCAKDARGARQGVIVDGPSMGKTQWFKRTGTSNDRTSYRTPEDSGPTPKQRLKALEEEFAKQKAFHFLDVAREAVERSTETPPHVDVLSLAAVFGLAESEWQNLAKDHAEAVLAAEAGVKKWAEYVWKSVSHEMVDRLSRRWGCSPEQMRIAARICLGAIVDATEVTAMEEAADAEIKESPELLTLRETASKKPGKKGARKAKQLEDVAGPLDVHAPTQDEAAAIDVDLTECKFCVHLYADHAKTSGKCKVKDCDCGSFEPNDEVSGDGVGDAEAAG